MLLKLDDIRKSYASGNPEIQRNVLDGLDLELDQGETIAILGPSGSGKSTLLNIIGTLDYPDSGEVIFDGRSLSDLDEKQLTRFRNREIGFIFQMHHLLPQFTVLENVLLPAIPLKKAGLQSSSMNRADKLIREVGLWEHRNQHTNVLSGGECQRAAVVRSLINNPRILLADEPTGSLDHENASNIVSLLLKLNGEFSTALIVVTHSEEIASRMSKIYKLKNGKLIHER
jgi:ABC-type lipoprotein export system ATPase subunit